MPLRSALIARVWWITRIMKKVKNKIKILKAGGFSLVEAILSLAIFMLMSTALVGALAYGIQGPQIAGANSRALLLAEEGLEVARNLRDASFTGLVAGTYGLAPVGGIWALSGLQDINGIFYRHLDIAAGSDANHKIVTSTVSYSTRAGSTSTVSLATLLTNWRRSGRSNWASSSLESSFDLTAANSGNDTANGISIAFLNNYVYLGRTSNGGREFYVFDVSVPASPALIGQVALGGSPNDLVAVGNYVYVASTDNNGELAIVNITVPSAPTVNVFNLTNGNSGDNNSDALSIASDGNYLYLGRTSSGGREFYIFDLINPASPALIGQASLAGNPNDIAVSGNYAYVASSDDSSELQIVDITNKAAPALLTSLNLNSGNNTADGLSLSYGSSTIFLGRAANAASPEYYTVNVATPTTPSLVGTLEIGANVNALYYDLASNYTFLATAAATNGFKVVDNSILAAPIILGEVNISVAPSELIYDPTLDRVFIASTADTQELQIIKPQ